jgi:hypothetical protein
MLSPLWLSEPVSPLWLSEPLSPSTPQEGHQDADQGESSPASSSHSAGQAALNQAPQRSSRSPPAARQTPLVAREEERSSAKKAKKAKSERREREERENVDMALEVEKEMDGYLAASESSEDNCPILRKILRRRPGYVFDTVTRKERQRIMMDDFWEGEYRRQRKRTKARRAR